MRFCGVASRLKIVVAEWSRALLLGDMVQRSAVPSNLVGTAYRAYSALLYVQRTATGRFTYRSVSE
jgi:hypothetical protein